MRLRGRGRHPLQAAPPDGHALEVCLAWHAELRAGTRALCTSAAIFARLLCALHPGPADHARDTPESVGQVLGVEGGAGVEPAPSEVDALAHRMGVGL